MKSEMIAFMVGAAVGLVCGVAIVGFVLTYLSFSNFRLGI